MGERCPHCGQLMPQPTETDPRRVITSREELLSLLRERADRDVYRSRSGTWHYTNPGPDRHRVDPALVREMVASGLLRPVYKGSVDAFSRRQTVDVAATMQMRRSGRIGKDTVIYA